MIILLGLQILKMANQLTSGPMATDPNGHSLPMFNTVMPNHYTNDQSLDKNNVNESNSVAKPSSPQESIFSKRMGFSNTLSTLSQRNQSIPKYSKHKIIPKPYPYSSGSIDSQQNSYAFPNSGNQGSEAAQKFSERYIKPDWNRFEDSIDDSLEEPLDVKDYAKNYDKQNIKSDEKRSQNIDNSYTTDDSFDTDYNGPHTEEPEEAYITSEPFDFDIDKEDDKEDKDDKDDYIVQDYAYKEEETPECAYGHSFCYSDDQYPEEPMRRAVDKQMDILTQILPESTDTFDLVDGVTKERDENYTYIDEDMDLYNSESIDRISYAASPRTRIPESHNKVKYKDGGYICPSYVSYLRPKRAQNNDGLWKVILNLNETYRGVDYNQHTRIEECVYEKIKCSFAPNYYNSECVQKYSNERLLAWTPDKGIHLDVFRLPIACSCHLTLNTQNTPNDYK